MVKTLYLMRHGETLFNKLHKIQGWCDSPLTEEGIKQSIKAREWFKEQHIVFDHAYSSTSERCKTLTNIMEKDDHHSVLAVSHGGACFNFLRGIQDPTEELKKGFMKMTSI